MVKKSSHSSGKFGARYGAPLKHLLAGIEKKQKATYTCPRCMKDKVKRVSSGIWMCKKCNTKFAGKAYEFGE